MKKFVTLVFVMLAFFGGCAGNQKNTPPQVVIHSYVVEHKPVEIKTSNTTRRKSYRKFYTGVYDDPRRVFFQNDSENIVYEVYVDDDSEPVVKLGPGDVGPPPSDIRRYQVGTHRVIFKGYRIVRDEEEIIKIPLLSDKEMSFEVHPRGRAQIIYVQ